MPCFEIPNPLLGHGLKMIFSLGIFLALTPDIHFIVSGMPKNRISVTYESTRSVTDRDFVLRFIVSGSLRSQ